MTGAGASPFEGWLTLPAAARELGVSKYRAALLLEGVPLPCGHLIVDPKSLAECLPVNPTARVPAEPLYRLLEADAGRRLYPAELAKRVGSNRTQVVRARTRGLLVDMADDWATNAGYHPSLVWTDWFTITGAAA